MTGSTEESAATTVAEWPEELAAVLTGAVDLARAAVEEFIRGRRVRNDSAGIDRNSLSGSDVSLVRKLAPTVFWPRPKVESAIVLIRPSAARRAHVGDPGRLRVFLRDLYAHRRKNLRGALAALLGRKDVKQEVDRRLADLGIDGAARAETLSLEEHLRLCAAFAS